VFALHVVHFVFFIFATTIQHTLLLLFKLALEFSLLKSQLLIFFARLGISHVYLFYQVGIFYLV